MYTIYRARADKLDSRFLESVKAAFGSEQVEITVSSADETEYLFSSPANRKRLLDAIADVESNRNLLEPDQKVFQ